MANLRDPAASADAIGVQAPPNWFPPRVLDDWLACQSLEATYLPTFMDGLAEQLAALGLPVWRLHISRPTIDPLASGNGCTWKRGETSVWEDYAHGLDAEDRWQLSPIKTMIEGSEGRMRRRLVGPEAQVDYPVLEEFRDEGATDWIGFAKRFTPSNNPTMLQGMVLTVVVDGPGGLTGEQEALLEWLAPRVAGIVFRLTMVLSAVTILEAYIGHDAGMRIINGQIKRGDVVRIPAVLFICDLRGFTLFAEETPAEEVISALNGYLGITADAVAEGGGEVLKFLGDGLLAIFSLEERDEAEGCEAALVAAESSLRQIAALNESREAKGLQCLQMDIALHRGRVLYGNIGSARRLDFTVIGAAVNQASRIEALCKSLDRRLLMSESFAVACPRDLHCLGDYSLRGVAEPQTLYALD